MDLLANLIHLAKSGKNGQGAIPVLRDICREAASAAPPADLIRMSQFLYDLRAEAAREGVMRN